MKPANPGQGPSSPLETHLFSSTSRRYRFAPARTGATRAGKATTLPNRCMPVRRRLGSYTQKNLHAFLCNTGRGARPETVAGDESVGDAIARADVAITRAACSIRQGGQTRTLEPAHHHAVLAAQGIPISLTVALRTSPSVLARNKI
jgi:hypothetical protein